MSSVSDILAHLRPCKITVDFEQVSYTIPALDAIEWVALIDGEHPDLYAIFPQLAGGQAVDAVEDALWEGRTTHDEVGRLALEVISTAADRPWWEVLKILGAAKGAWRVVHVNRAAGMSLAGWLDEVWTSIMRHIDNDKRAAWVADVESPPKGFEQQLDFDAEERAFMAAMNAVMR